MRLRNDLASKDDEVKEATSLMETRTFELRQELDQTRSSLLEARKTIESDEATKEKLDDVQSVYDRLQRDILTERTRHESREAEMRVDMAKMEGRLRAGETTLRQKRDLVEELEEKLQRASEKSSLAVKEAQKERDELRKQLEVAQQQLDKDRASLDGKSEMLAGLESEQRSLRKRADHVSELEKSIAKLQCSLSDVEDEKITLTVELTKLNKDYDRVVERLQEYEERQDLNESLTAELELRDRQVNAVSEQYERTIKELQEKLSEERKTKEELSRRLGSVSTDIEGKDLQLSRLPRLQEQLREMTAGREELQDRLGRVEAELERKERQITLASERYSASVSEYQSKLDKQARSKEELEEKLESVEAELGKMSGPSQRTGSGSRTSSGGTGTREQ